ncbi:hypothetical protein MTR_0030s0160 [Medicago truncatula]|uniref:Replication protein A 70 kDa DNA-binding subunit B/D first OB fold domain-containing protein n=1 Tax=Medicago truncatula TaxID=3880 RepID=G7ZUG7_MEDTR|nr:hypothetical protein MTR_0030s0160 [Medicago truncatula]
MLHTITKGWFLQSCPYTLTPNVNIIALISRGTCIHPDTTQWRLKRNKLKVLVIQRDLIIPYKNSRNEGTFLTIILLDEEGTKVQATLLNKHKKTCKDALKKNKSYYISKGLLDHVNPNYSSVHKEVELSFTDNTII